MTIWFENLVTGQRWDVSHPDLISRLKSDKGYKTIEDPTKPEIKPKKARKT